MWRDTRHVNSKNNNNEEKTELKEVYLTESTANELIEYVPVTKFNELSDFAFLDKKVTVSEMNINSLVYIAMKKVQYKGTCTKEQFNANGICDWTYKKSDVEDSIKNLYGLTIEMPKKVNNNFLFRCTLVDDTYACSNSGGGTTSNGPVWDYFVFGDKYIAKYQKALKDDNNLYIYVKFARIGLEGRDDTAEKPEDFNFKIYKYGNNNELIDNNLLNGKDYCEADRVLNDYGYYIYQTRNQKSLGEKVYDNYKDKLTDYKITYKINQDNNYSLLSVEPIFK